jgi:DNA (cytosine-5)-methyltransferase 1
VAAYYNEIDPFAAAWLRELIKAGLIADGEVDERSIEFVQPDDLRGFTQCHFFAGIGGWSYALRLAGWPDVRHVWTGSCPCQPWSMAGRGEGASDPRHLWPAWERLIGVLCPPVVFGEQVASKDGRYWLDLVFHDLEVRGYAIGAIDLPACCVGAPHQRQRLWFVADSDRERISHNEQIQVDGSARADEGEARQRERFRVDAEPSSDALCDCGHRADEHDFGAEECNECSCIRFIGALEHPYRSRAERIASGEGRAQRAPSSRRQDEGSRRLQALDPGIACELGNANGAGLAQRQDAEIGGRALRLEGSAVGAPGATRGVWADCEWLWHRDGKYRAVEPGTFPLAPRLSGDMEQIHAYGNAIVPQVAAVFIEAYCEARGITA